MKPLLAQNGINNFPDLNVCFEIYTDASDYQLGAVITPFNTTSCIGKKKQTKTQHSYSTMEKELLAVFLCLRVVEHDLWRPAQYLQQLPQEPHV